ncbi:MAG: cytochrome c biogenesis protein CcsA [Planctomycetota bacterium]
MKWIFFLLLLLKLTIVCADPETKKTSSPDSVKFDYSIFGQVPVQNEGRIKPLDSLLREAIWTVTGKSSWTKRDQQTGKVLKKYLPIELVLAIEFKELNWQEEPLIECSYDPILEQLQLSKNRLFCSYNEIKNNEWFRETIQTITWREDPTVNIDKPIKSKLESEAQSLYQRFQWLEAIGNRNLANFVPDTEKNKPWLSLHQKLPYSEEIQKELNAQYQKIGESWMAGDPETFRKYSEKFAQLLKTLQPTFYPQETILLQEYRYNQVSPFQKALLFYGLAIFFYSFGFKWTRFKWLAHFCLILGFATHSWGIYQRVIISGRAPVSNMYESMIFFGWSAIAFGIIFELIYRKGWCGFAAAICGATVQIITDNVSLNPNLPVLEPVLKSVYLTYHVLLMMVSYSAFGISLVFSHLFLFTSIFKPEKKELLKDLDTYNYRIIQLGCVGIIFGIFLGAVWANESWGRYWAWDPKETWALITFLSYLAILHGRVTNWWKALGSAVGSLLSFGVLLMTYYGVNFFLVGKHSYAGASADTPIPPSIAIYAVVEAFVLLAVWVQNFLRNPKTPAEPIELHR